jgi:hypothetical protein
MANSIPCDSLQQWSNQYDFDNAGANTYVNKVYLRTQDAGNANNVSIALVDTVYIGNQVVTVSCSAVSVKGIPTVSWVQFDFEANGESHLFTWTILPRTGNIFLSMIIVQGEARGPVYE